jgi:glutamate dehydrogenase (NAD(P)+)
MRSPRRMPFASKRRSSPRRPTVTPEGDRILEKAGIFLIPDILCNAGRVTVSYFERVQDVHNRLERVMKASFGEGLEIHLDRKVSQCLAANMLGVSRVAEATKIRGLYP